MFDTIVRVNISWEEAAIVEYGRFAIDNVVFAMWWVDLYD